MTDLKKNEPLIISACLMGEPCRFDGQSKERKDLLVALKDKQHIPVCPEVEGGLPTPRPPAEISGNKVLRKNGEDVTQQFKKGAHQCTAQALSRNATSAILKSRSPACGCGLVYDGSFSGTLVEGDGLFTQSLKAAGIDCVSDEDYLKNIK